MLKFNLYQLFIGTIIFSSADIYAFEKEINGVVLDLQTLEPIPFVTIISSRSGAVTDSKGAFSIKVNETDTLIFSHVNYEKNIVYVSSMVSATKNVYLTPVTHQLREIIITDIPTEEEFIEQVLEYKVEPSEHEEIAKLNFQNARYIYFTDWRPEMDSKDNYSEYLKGPQPFTFFSTDPRKGIMSLFRKKHPLPRVKFNQQKFYSSDSSKYRHLLK